MVMKAMLLQKMLLQYCKIFILLSFTTLNKVSSALATADSFFHSSHSFTICP